MKKFLLLSILMLPLSCLAQYVNLTATVTDPSGNLYQNCSGSANFSNQNTTVGSGPPLLYGSTFQTQVPFNCDSTGTFTARLAGNDQVTPGPSQWSFTICDQTRKYCFTTLQTVNYSSGASQNFSTQISAASVPIPGGPSFNAQTLLGKTWASPPTTGIGNVTPVPFYGSFNGSFNGPIGQSPATPSPGSFTTATFSQKPWYDVTAYGATGNAKMGIDGVTNGTTTFTSPSAPFNCATDIHKAIQIQYGTNSTTALATTIAGCTSSSTITLATSAPYSASGQMFFWGTDDAAAIIAAKTAASTAGGGTVFLPAGTYLVSSAPVITTNTDTAISFQGTCPYMGSRVIALGGNPPTPQCTTILDGTNNNTIQFNSAVNFSFGGMLMISFPNATSTFVRLAGSSDGTSEVFDGLLYNLALWGKYRPIYGHYTIENVRVTGVAVGCAGLAGIQFISDLTSGMNMVEIDHNYVELQNFPGTPCGVTAPLYGIQTTSLGVTGGGGAQSGVKIRSNLVQLDNAVASSIAIDCGACLNSHLEDNDIENQRSGGGFSMLMRLGTVNGYQAVSNVINGNNLFSDTSITTALQLNDTTDNIVMPENISSGGTITNGIEIYGGSGNDVRFPRTFNVTNPIVQDGGTGYNPILTAALISLPANFITIGYTNPVFMPTSPENGESLNIEGDVAIGSDGGGANYCLKESPGDTGSWYWQGNIMGGLGIQFGLGVTCGTGPSFAITGAGINTPTGKTIISQGGSNIVYRCSTAGTVRAGTLTTVSTDCGTAVDTGLRVP